MLLSLLFLAAASAAVLAGCDGDPSDTSESVYIPPSEEAAPPPEPEPEPEPEPPSGEYPLTQAEALSRVQAGVPVFGLLPNGFEILVIESSETVYEQQPVEKEVCDYEYDPVYEEDVPDCRYETVYEDKPVEKTVYVVRGGGYSPVSYDTGLEAITQATLYGAERWR